MQFERNDDLFSLAASRFGVTEATVEDVVLSMMWAGERALDAPPIANHLQRVVRRTLLGLSTKGDFAKHVAVATHPLNEVTTLAICIATHRLCLWFRAHEVSDAEALANYFETAFSYYAEYWKGKPGDEVTTAMSSFESKLTSCRAPARGRTTGGASQGGSSTAKGKRTPAVVERPPPIVELPQMTTSAGKTRGTRPPSGHPRMLQRTLGAGAGQSRRDSADNIVGASAGRPLATTLSPSGPTTPAPKFSTSLDIEVKQTTRPDRAATKGRCVQMEPSRRDNRPEKVGTWIVLAKGRAAAGTPLVETDETAATARRSALLGAVADGPSAPAAMAPSPALRRANPGPALRGENALVFEDDTDETNWWTRRYDSPAEDSDFEPEHSDLDPNSDIDDDEMGEEGKPTTLDVSFDEDSDGGLDSEDDETDEDESNEESDSGESDEDSNSEGVPEGRK
eukprot:m.75380 g.75380  ORF g.75380 m.75380 type:complete len:453 (+) comp10410_c0_seq1:236-1594(+)